MEDLNFEYDSPTQRLFERAHMEFEIQKVMSRLYYDKRELTKALEHHSCNSAFPEHDIYELEIRVKQENYDASPINKKIVGYMVVPKGEDLEERYHRLQKMPNKDNFRDYLDIAFKLIAYRRIDLNEMKEVPEDLKKQ